MIKIFIDDNKVEIEAIASPEELKLLKSIANELCNGECREGAE